MPDWTGSFSMPRFSTEEFEAKKAAHNSEHGYKIYIPDFDDIVHYKYTPKMTTAEELAWETKDWSQFSDERLAQLAEEKLNKKQAYQRMLDSPSPEILRARSSIMTSIDNAQDALGTLAVIGSIARVVAPRAIAGLIGGPVGWVITAASLLNLANTLLRGPGLPLVKKRKAQDTTKKNPRAKKARCKLAKKLAAARINRFSAIEALQTTDNIFGVGLCLGPIMGLGGDLLAGAVRAVAGQDVSVKWNPPEFPPHEAAAAAAMKSLNVCASTIADISDEDRTKIFMAANLAAQMNTETSKDWNPLDAVDNIDQVETEAPKPTNPLIREVMQEAGHDPDKHVAWPTTGKRWSTYNEIGDSSSDVITQNYRDYEDRTKNDWGGFLGACSVADGSQKLIAQFEGEDSVAYDFVDSSRFITGMYDRGLEFGPYTTEQQLAQLAAMLEYTEGAGARLPVGDFMRYASDPRGMNIQFVPVGQ